MFAKTPCPRVNWDIWGQRTGSWLPPALREPRDPEDALSIPGGRQSPPCRRLPALAVTAAAWRGPALPGARSSVGRLHGERQGKWFPCTKGLFPSYSLTGGTPLVPDSFRNPRGRRVSKTHHLSHKPDDGLTARVLTKIGV